MQISDDMKSHALAIQQIMRTSGVESVDVSIYLGSVEIRAESKDGNSIEETTWTWYTAAHAQKSEVTDD